MLQEHATISRRCHNYDVMSSGHSYFQRSLGLILPFDILDIHVVAALLLQQLPPVEPKFLVGLWFPAETADDEDIIGMNRLEQKNVGAKQPVRPFFFTISGLND